MSLGDTGAHEEWFSDTNLKQGVNLAKVVKAMFTSCLLQVCRDNYPNFMQEPTERPNLISPRDVKETFVPLGDCFCVQWHCASSS